MKKESNLSEITMIKFNESSLKRNSLTIALKLFISVVWISLSCSDVSAQMSGDDIILTKGKLIMRGGRGKGNLILDTGSHSNGQHHAMPHFNPFAFYPMQAEHHDHQPHMMIHPIYIEDHSAMHQKQHHIPEHHQMHHEEPNHHVNHEVHQYHQHEPIHQEIHHEEHQEVHHEPHEQHHESHHGQHHFEVHPIIHDYNHESHHNGHHEDGGHHASYGSHPMMAMMMHGTGPAPLYHQFSGLEALQSQNTLANQQYQLTQNMKEKQTGEKSTGNQQQSSQQNQQTSPSEQQKKILPIGKGSLGAIIKKLNPIKQKKP